MSAFHPLRHSNPLQSPAKMSNPQPTSQLARTRICSGSSQSPHCSCVEAAVERDDLGANFLPQPSKLLLTTTKKCQNSSQSRLVFDATRQPIRMDIELPEVSCVGSAAMLAYLAFAGHERGSEVKDLRDHSRIGLKATDGDSKHGSRVAETHRVSKRPTLMSANHPKQTFRSRFNAPPGSSSPTPW
jgi:hypothetical protein